MPVPPKATLTPPKLVPVDPVKGNLPASYYKAAIWSEIANSKAWTETVITSLRKVWPSLGLASDIEDFCPKYKSATTRQQEICWLRLTGGVAKLESDLHPLQIFKEPKTGELSIGLMQMSQSQCESHSARVPNLFDPSDNLKCAIGVMANLVKTDGYIDGPIWARGAAASWSTLRKPYEFLGLLLGKRSQVIEFTKNYASY